ISVANWSRASADACGQHLFLLLVPVCVDQILLADFETIPAIVAANSGHNRNFRAVHAAKGLVNRKTENGPLTLKYKAFMFLFKLIPGEFFSGSDENGLSLPVSFAGRGRPHTSAGERGLTD